MLIQSPHRGTILVVPRGPRPSTVQYSTVQYNAIQYSTRALDMLNQTSFYFASIFKLQQK